MPAPLRARDDLREPVSLARRLFEAEGAVEVPEGPRNISGYYVYMVYQGQNILQIGHGKGRRLYTVMRGGLASKHNKAFICAAGEAILGGRNQYLYVRVSSKEAAKAVEERIHAGLGIRTNEDCATLIEGFTGSAYVEIVEQIWTSLQDTPAYQSLSDVEKRMAKELIDIVTLSKSALTQRYGVQVKSAQGDNLSGSILAALGITYLIPVLDKLTNGYLRYGKHRPTEEQYRRMIEDYGTGRSAVVARPEPPREPRRVRIAAPVARVPAAGAPLPAPRPPGAALPDGAALVQRLEEGVIPIRPHVLGGGRDDRSLYMKSISSEYLGQEYITEISWALPDQPFRLVGYFSLNLSALLEGGYIYRDGNGGPLRLTVRVLNENELWICRNLSGPRISLARIA